MKTHLIEKDSVGIQVAHSGRVSDEVLPHGMHSTDYAVTVIRVHGLIPMPIALDIPDPRIHVEYLINPVWLTRLCQEQPWLLSSKGSDGRGPLGFQMDAVVHEHARPVLMEELKLLHPEEMRMKLHKRSSEVAWLHPFDELQPLKRREFLERASCNLMLVAEHKRPGSVTKLAYRIRKGG